MLSDAMCCWKPLKELITEAQINISISTKSLILAADGIHCRKPIKKPYLNDKRKEAHLNFAQTYINYDWTKLYFWMECFLNQVHYSQVIQKVFYAKQESSIYYLTWITNFIEESLQCFGSESCIITLAMNFLSIFPPTSPNPQLKKPWQVYNFNTS